jgi:peptide/nickel transport system ATP-binding protein
VALLEVTDLRVSFRTPDGIVDAVRGLSFSVEAGRTLSLVGESGSGKSVSMQAVMGLVRNARISGTALFDGRDLLALRPAQLRDVRGRQIAMVFQDPLSSLHPYYRIGWQIAEVLRAHEHGMSRHAARTRATELLSLVGIPDAKRRVDEYPHQFSGGMRQRAMIAMAMALNPRLLIADEPTTALDVSVQAQVLRLLRRMQEEFGTAIILITHDLGVTAEMADEVVVMYAGEAMERAGRRELFYGYRHPYTEGLLLSLPGGDGRERLQPIKGQPPSLIGMLSGCSFTARCQYAMPRCGRERPDPHPVGGDHTHLSACWLPDEMEEA